MNRDERGALDSGRGDVAECTLTPAHFARVTSQLHAHCGIRLREGKEALVRARLARRLRALNLPDFDAYLAYVDADPTQREFAEMIDVLTTNTTSFLREVSHFHYLRTVVLPALQGPVRLWSAGCSTGEEPYTLAMLLEETLADAASRDVRILATDISHRALQIAQRGIYPAAAMADVPPAWLERYWQHASDNGSDMYEARPSIRRLVSLARLNLMEHWPMSGQFDVILCRNVMIYFDKGTQQRLVERFHALLKPGGHLFVGHSESLTGLTHRFRYVKPAIYAR
jgi:chemotaxis protein methyltransferase CheR